MRLEEIDEQIKEKELELRNLRDLRIQEQSKERRKRSSSYQNQKELLKKTGEWLVGRLKEGDIVKVTGSRAGKYRRVISTSSGSLIGQVCYWKRGEFVADVSNVTTNGLTKVTHIFRDREFIKIADWMNE